VGCASIKDLVHCFVNKSISGVKSESCTLCRARRQKCDRGQETGEKLWVPATDPGLEKKYSQATTRLTRMIPKCDVSYPSTGSLKINSNFREIMARPFGDPSKYRDLSNDIVMCPVSSVAMDILRWRKENNTSGPTPEEFLEELKTEHINDVFTGVDFGVVDSVFGSAGRK
jgi:hypothetical protein